MWSQCYASSLERPDRINRTTVLSVKAVVENGPTVLMTPIMCDGTAVPMLHVYDRLRTGPSVRISECPYWYRNALIQAGSKLSRG